MPCYRPLTAYRNPNGGPLLFSSRYGYGDRSVKVACGQCMGCRLEYSRVWAVRCSHEASLYEDNCFVTLTYSDDTLPFNGSLVKADFVGFHKRLRDRVGYGRFRFYACGEYGETTNRPHYHAILFNYDFPDKQLFTTSRSGHRLYTSEFLNDVWGFGHCQIGSVSFDSAAYVARYVTKKVTGPLAADHYAGREPEFSDMSRRPGIGSAWLKKFTSDVYPSDNVVVNGVRCRPPRFYDNCFEVIDPVLFARIRGKRVSRGRDKPRDSDYRLKQREEAVARSLSVRSSTPSEGV